MRSGVPVSIGVLLTGQFARVVFAPSALKRAIRRIGQEEIRGVEVVRVEALTR